MSLVLITEKGVIDSPISNGPVCMYCGEYLNDYEIELEDDTCQLCQERIDDEQQYGGSISISLAQHEVEYIIRALRQVPVMSNSDEFLEEIEQISEKIKTQAKTQSDYMTFE